VVLRVRYEGSCPKHVELILEINKLLLLHLVGFLYYFTYIDDARSNTNQIVYNLFNLFIYGLFDVAVAWIVYRVFKMDIMPVNVINQVR
jgi:heme/copper-type cytochrome/quinol oxidase subunit 4